MRITMLMLTKAVAIAIALSSTLSGCGVHAEAKMPETAQDTQNTSEPVFAMDQVESYDDFTIYQDRQTKVQYIVYDEWIVLGDRHVFGIVPRYNTDGSVYVGG